MCPRTLSPSSPRQPRDTPATFREDRTTAGKVTGGMRGTHRSPPGSAGRWGAGPGSAGPGSSHCARWGPSRLLGPGGLTPRRAPAATPPAGKQRRSGDLGMFPGHRCSEMTLLSLGLSRHFFGELSHVPPTGSPSAAVLLSRGRWPPVPANGGHRDATCLSEDNGSSVPSRFSRAAPPAPSPQAQL